MEIYRKAELEDEVENLRSEWANEMCARKRETEGGGEARVGLARRIYDSGLRAESAGNIALAVEQYRRATALVEDIERQMVNRLQVGLGSIDCRSNTPDQEICDVSNNYVTEIEEQISAILRLPDELLLYIIRWIVGVDIDIYSLLVLNKVCQKFLSLSRDEQLWRLVCQKLWPFCAHKDCFSFGGTWRSMAITRPHLLYHGCYIGSVTYFRKGETMTSSSYSPLLIVRYFRVFRFKPDGSVIMILSSSDLQDIIKQLSLFEDHDISTLLPQLSHSGLSLSMGTFTVEGSKIYLRLTRVPNISYYCYPLKFHRRFLPEESPKQLMDISLQLKHSNKRPNHVLQWSSYSLSSVVRNEVLMSNFDVKSDKYPRLVFSRVRAFCSRLSEAPI